MNLSRPSRFVAALITLFSLLFTQLAVASYACPEWKGSPASVSADTGHANMGGCSEMDEKQPGMCKAHCDSSRQTLDTPGTPHVPPFVAGELACVLPDPGLSAAVHHRRAIARSPLRTTSPPIAIRNCCFRI
jgi:hypothetical protein